MAEEIETLGSYLRRERKKRDISVEQIAYATRISLKMLTALEEDRHIELPAQPFVRGYLQAYAKYMKLDPKDILLRYQHHLATQPVSSNKDVFPAFEDEKSHYMEKHKIIAIMSVLFVLLCGSGLYFWIKGRLQEENAKLISRAPILKNVANANKQAATIPPNAQKIIVSTDNLNISSSANKPADNLTDLPKPPLPTTTTKPVDAKPEPAIVTEPQPTPTPEQTASNPPTTPRPEQTSSPAVEEDNTPKKFNLALKAKEDVWVRYQTDTDEVKDLFIRKDKMITIRANKVIKMFSGNVKGLSGILNGEPLETLTQGDWKRSIVIPFSEITNTPLPLFPGSPGEGSSETKPSHKSAEKKESTDKSSNSQVQ